MRRIRVQAFLARERFGARTGGGACVVLVVVTIVAVGGVVAAGCGSGGAATPLVLVDVSLDGDTLRAADTIQMIIDERMAETLSGADVRVSPMEPAHRGYRLHHAATRVHVVEKAFQGAVLVGLVDTYWMGPAVTEKITRLRQDGGEAGDAGDAGVMDAYIDSAGTGGGGIGGGGGVAAGTGGAPRGTGGAGGMGGAPSGTGGTIAGTGGVSAGTGGAPAGTGGAGTGGGMIAGTGGMPAGTGGAGTGGAGTGGAGTGGAPTGTGGAGGAGGSPYTCEAYCAQLDRSVSGSNCLTALYAGSAQDCLDTCRSFKWRPNNTNGVATALEDTIQCRLVRLPNGCEFASASGAHTCPLNPCSAYCDAMMLNCPSAFSGADACLNACNASLQWPVQGDTGALVDHGPTSECQLYWAGHAGRPGADQATDCTNAMIGSTVCQ